MRRIYCIMIFALLVCSCNRGQIGKALTALDDVIRQSDVYEAEFIAKADDIKRHYRDAETEELKWALADSLYQMYYCNNLDSSLFYLGRMELHAVTRQQQLRTEMSALTIRMVRLNQEEAIEQYHRLDTTGLLTDKDVLKSYYSTGIALYYHLYKSDLPDEQRVSCRQTLQEHRAQYIYLDTDSFYAQKIIAQYDRDNGDYKAALDRFMDIYVRETDHHERASTAYNIATIHKYLGNDDERIVWLAKSAEEDFRSAGKDYLSLYELALMLYDRGMYIEANNYIERNLADAFFGNFNSRYISSGKAHVLVNDAERHRARNQMILMTVIICVLVVMMLLMLGLLKYSARQRKRVKEQRDMLRRVNDEVRQLNSNLRDANKIKDNYVFRYMEMSIRYLDRFDDFRNHIRSVAHSKGLEEAMKHLRSREDMYQEYDNFYTVFDETFLGIYPDFVQKVNALLREDARFPVPTTRVLRTELRVLAAIRLGITESGKIASFLKCAPPTVYTYRAKLRNYAICDKDKFEDLVREIQ
ncbi:MAG: hypothetical protein E7117_10530 [Bacteroidales bacterium]|nr:hypothetical protein [Bacteroidales bacterium]